MISPADTYVMEQFLRLLTTYSQALIVACENVTSEHVYNQIITCVCHSATSVHSLRFTITIFYRCQKYDLTYKSWFSQRLHKTKMS